jgi:hypothetical protein
MIILNSPYGQLLRCMEEMEDTLLLTRKGSKDCLDSGACAVATIWIWARIEIYKILPFHRP